MSTQEASTQSCPKPFHKEGVYAYFLWENPPARGQSYPVGLPVLARYLLLVYAACRACVVCKPVLGTRLRSLLPCLGSRWPPPP